MVIDKEDLDKKVVESFLESSLAGLPKIALITDGAPLYPDIIDKIGMKHQLCIFHIIKNHHTDTFKNIRRVSRRINTINKEINRNKTTIDMLKEDIQDDDYSEKKKKKKRNRINKLTNENKDLRKERKEKKDN